MTRQRLEAFSDSIIAIIMTIMVFKLNVPKGDDLNALIQIWPALFTYLLSFLFLGIYWNNHHHLFHAVDKVNGKILWANLHLLFWLSLIPFVTDWTEENRFESMATSVYGVVLLLSAIAYWILVNTILTHQGTNSKLREAIGKDYKGKISIGLYILAIPLALVNCWIAMGIYVIVALMWLVPDRRIEKYLL